MILPRPKYCAGQKESQEHAEMLPMVTDFARKTIDYGREQNRNNLYQAVSMN